MSATVNSGIACPDPADELRRGEGPPAEVEEARVGLRDRHAQHRLPLLGEPGGGCPEARGIRLDTGERPGQGGAVDLAGGAGRELVDDREQRHERGRELLDEAGPGGGRDRTRRSTAR